MSDLRLPTETLRELRGHALLTPEIVEQLPDLSEPISGEILDELTPLKLFSPTSRYTLFVIRLDLTADRLGAYSVSALSPSDDKEWVVGSFTEIEAERLDEDQGERPLVERDLSFTPKTVRAALDAEREFFERDPLLIPFLGRPHSTS